MRPDALDIAVPPFPPHLEWVGPALPPVDRVCARGPLLVHFIDAAHPSSVRTLPYLSAWNERYSSHGLTVLAVNSPRFSFTGDRAKLATTLERLGVAFPVAVDAEYRAWRDYGCKGWPSLFLWARGGALRWFHFGEGEYAATEAAIQDELVAITPSVELPPLLGSLRPAEAPGAAVVGPSPEVFPGGSISTPWRAAGPEDSLELEYAAGGAWATVDGEGTLHASLDGGAAQTIDVDAAGAYELSGHERHQAHRLSLVASPSLSVYSVAFAAGVPPGRRR